MSDVNIQQDADMHEISMARERIKQIGNTRVTDAMSAGSIVLHELARVGAANFRHITNGTLARTEGSHLNENSFYTAIARLRRRKMIDKGGYGYALTPRGEWAAMKAAVQRGMNAKRIISSTWDGKWRMILFDFPEKKRSDRDYVRGVLKKTGFKEFQRSTWISPHKIPSYLMKLLKDQRLKDHVRVITTNDINYDKDLRRQFKLQ